MITPPQTATPIEYTPKRSAFFEQMQSILPCYRFGIAEPEHTPTAGVSGSASGDSKDSPTTNRGVKGLKREVIPGEKYPPSILEALGFSKDKDYSPLEDLRTIAVGNKSKYELVRVPLSMDVNPSFSFIDWINFTFKTDDFFHSPLWCSGFYDDKTVSMNFNDSIIADLSRHLIEILGYGITVKPKNHARSSCSTQKMTTFNCKNVEPDFYIYTTDK